MKSNLTRNLKLSAKLLLYFYLLFFISQFSYSEQVYLESGGVVRMEAENTQSPLGLWVTSTFFPGYSGSGHLEFTGNAPNGAGTPGSPLKYNFKIETEGDYALIFRGRSRLLNGEASDLCNDAWVKLEGDFSIGAGGPPAMSWLTQDTKMFVGRGGNGDWGWASKFDINHVQPSAIYHFKAGEVYTLTVSGRSTRFNIDRILFVKTTANQTVEKNGTTESATYDDGSAVERYEYQGITDFTNINAGAVTYYKDNARKALAIDASVVADRDKFARATADFTGKSAKYDVTLTTLAEFDGECTYRFLVNGVVVGTYQNTRVSQADDYQLQNVVFKAITINTNDIIAVESNTHTNLLISEGEGTAWARGRWKSISMSPAVYQGRVAVVADGNYRDSDDIAGTPISLAILKSLGLEKKLVHYSHSCDLKPGGSDPGGEFREVEMQLSCDGTASRWGGFEHLTFYNCMKQKSATISDLTTQINNSTETDPLWIIEAGEPDIMWEAVNASNVAKRKYIHVVTHHPANDVGDDHDLSDVMALGIPSVNLHSIPDQNTLLKKPLADWYWARDHADDRIKWLWERGFTAQTAAMNYPAIVGSFDCSDAGMIYYWATIETGADMAPDVPKLKKLFLDYLALAPVKAKFVSPTETDVIVPGSNVTVEAELTADATDVISVELFINNVSVRTITAAPFVWGATDAVLLNIKPGSYNMKLLATSADASTSEAFLTIEVPAYAYFVTPNEGLEIVPGSDLQVEAGLNVATDKIAHLELFVNTVSVRKINTAPFIWGAEDVTLKDLAVGNYDLLLVATTTTAEVSESRVKVIVKTIPKQEPYSGTPIAIPGRFENEDYDLGGEGLAYHDSNEENSNAQYRTDGVDVGVVTEGIYVVGNTVNGEWLEYTIDVASDGMYDVDFHYASGRPTGGAEVGVELNDEGIVLIPSFPLPKLANWQTYETINIGNVSLQKGIQVLRVNVVSAGFNLDWMEFTRTDVVGINEISINRLNIFPNPSGNGIFTLEKNQKWEVYNLMGVKILKGEGNNVDISRWQKGIYILKTEDSINKILFE